MSGENPATVSSPDWERDWGREEVEGEQEREHLVMSPFCWVTGGGDQEKFTCLCPASASNISGAPVGTVNEVKKNSDINTLWI